MERLRNWLRDLVPRSFILLVLAVLAGAAWLTRNPDAPLVRRAEEWPFVGPVASWFRERYQPVPPPGGGPAPAPGDPSVSWTPPTLPPAGERRIVWVLPGTQLHETPSAGAPVVRDISSIANAIRLERRGDWFRLHYAGSEGWAYLEGYDESGKPPYGEVPEPPRAMIPGPVDEDALAEARALLGDRERVSRVGPYTLYTDSADDELIRHLDGLADQVEAVYSKRYGREPLGSPRAVLVLYRSELSYRILERRSEKLADLHSAGHASGGLAVLFAAARSPVEVGGTLVHELVHFLNRRALGPALPPWIDEGLADDLALARRRPDGRLDPTGLRGERRQEDGKLQVSGGLATLQHLRDAIRDGRLPAVRDLLHLDWESFVRSDLRQLHYGASAFWVRYLLDGGNGRRADAFRRFLAGVGAGESASPENLRRLLGEDWAALDRGFRAWLAELPPRNVLEPIQDARTRGSSSRHAASPPA